MLGLLIFIGYLALTAFSLAALWRYRQGSPMFWFVCTLALMALGTMPLLDYSWGSDQTYVAMFTVAMICFVSSVLLMFLALPMRTTLQSYAARPEHGLHENEVVLCAVFFVLSIIVTILYFYEIGYNVLWLLLSGQLDDYSTMRIETYSGENYFAPGYVNQFKNVLLPLTALILTFHLGDAKVDKSIRIAFALVAWPIVFVALAGTGQRGFLAYTLAAIVMAFSLRRAGTSGQGDRGKLVLIGIPVLLLFGVMTGAYAGVDDGGPSAIIAKMLERVTSIQQEDGLAGFRYIYLLQTAWFSEWMQSVIGILPYVEGSRLSHEIHAILYGSDRGTAPLSAVGSAYYNGAIFGVILLYSICGIVYSGLYYRFLKGRKSLPRTLSYGFLFLYLAIYVADSPVILLDNGALTLVIFLILLKMSRSMFGYHKHPQPAALREEDAQMARSA